jgi:hypothetical protein
MSVQICRGWSGLRSLLTTGFFHANMRRKNRQAKHEHRTCALQQLLFETYARSHI